MNIADVITKESVLAMVVKSIRENPDEVIMIDPAVISFLKTNFDYYERVEFVAYQHHVTIVSGRVTR